MIYRGVSSLWQRQGVSKERVREIEISWVLITCIATRQLSRNTSVNRPYSCLVKPSWWMTFICLAKVDLPASPVPGNDEKRSEEIAWTENANGLRKDEGNANMAWFANNAKDSEQKVKEGKEPRRRSLNTAFLRSSLSWDSISLDRLSASTSWSVFFEEEKQDIRTKTAHHPRSVRRTYALCLNPERERVAKPRVGEQGADAWTVDTPISVACTNPPNPFKCHPLNPREKMTTFLKELWTACGLPRIVLWAVRHILCWYVKQQSLFSSNQNDWFGFN